eukprot:CAMPEP_0113478636 /NCGR_PEP_ID=MMETSP0014_2-20120614/20864_1 /TAXON_ID=2857 /ORGANISM="Nitzschia sp." /LENGTH=1138 /DNA_ID=CAMNT_0000371845 /DNA_START=289 /DNA_END=3708 /DNA_ORIENTATION=- /assembly_acc=CAM_ASM_000159
MSSVMSSANHDEQRPSSTHTSKLPIWKPNGKRLGKLKSKLLNSKLLSPSQSSASASAAGGGGGALRQFNLASGEGGDYYGEGNDDGSVNDAFDGGFNHNDSEHLLSSSGMDFSSNLHVVSTWQERDDMFLGISADGVDINSTHSSTNTGSRRNILFDDDEDDNNNNNNKIVKSASADRGGLSSNSNYNNDVHWWMTPQFDPNAEREVAVTKLQEQIAQLEAERDHFKLTCQTQEQQLFDALATKMNLAAASGAITASTPSTACMTSTPDSKQSLSHLENDQPSPFVSHSAAYAAAFTKNDDDDGDDDVFDFFGLMMEDSESGSANNNNKLSGGVSITSAGVVGESEDKQNPSTTVPEQINSEGFPVAATTDVISKSGPVDLDESVVDEDDDDDDNVVDVDGDQEFNVDVDLNALTTDTDDKSNKPDADEQQQEEEEEEEVVGTSAVSPVALDASPDAVVVVSAADDAKVNVSVPQQVDIAEETGKEDHNISGQTETDNDVEEQAQPEGMSGFEIDGISLLDERDHLDVKRNPHQPLTGATVQQYKDMKNLMTFNALQLIQKQKKWLDEMSGKKSPASMIAIKIELENLERKIRAPEENDISESGSAAGKDDGEKRVDLSGETAQLEAAVEAGKAKAKGTKPPFVPMEPSKAMFKAMSLLDDSLQHFQKGCMKGFGKMNQLLKALKEDVDHLEARNSTLVEEISVLQKQRQQQTGTNMALLTSLQKLKAERDNFAAALQSVEEQLSSMAPQSGVSSEEEKKDNDGDDNDGVGASVIAKVSRLQAYIETLKVDAKAETEFESELSCITQQASGESASSEQLPHVTADLRKQVEQLTKSNESLAAQHSSEKLELRSNLEASWKQVNHLTNSLAERNSSIATFVQETNAAKDKLSSLEEENRNFKAVADEKTQLLLTATSRIDVLQEELLRTEEELRSVEMQYASQKNSAVEELRRAENQYSEELQLSKAHHSESRRILEEKLTTLESEHDRMVRDLKAAITELESERDMWKSQVSSGSKNDEMSDVPVDDIAKTRSVEDLEDQFKQEDQMAMFQSKMAQKAATQANLIAHLQHENDLKDAHMNEMKELIEHLSERQGGLKSMIANAKGRQWGSVMSKIGDRSFHGSSHGFGSNHGFGSSHG